MPPPTFHFAIGSFVGLIVLLFFLPFKKKWFVYLPFAVILFGFLAMTPDIGKYNKLPLSFSGNLTSTLHEESFNTLFFYHPYLDHNKDKYESSEDLDIFGYLAIVFFFSLTSVVSILYEKYLIKK